VEQADTPRAKAAKVIPCGDSIRFFSDGQEHFFALLCDGMGSGEDAAAISGICVSFLERLLRAGVGIDSALTLLNQHLCSRSISAAEFTSTVDLISVDLFSGKTHFIKSGAADSLILRGDQWYTVSSRTYPLGVLHSVDAQILPFSLQAGDRILMMSDGVMDTLLPEAITASSDADPGAAHLDLSDQPGWLYALLDTASLQSDSSTRDFLDRILTCARQHGSVDDMTVALLRVVAN
jgi:stage II sporulation protein E